MKKLFLISCALLSSLLSMAQKEADPVVMTVANEPITRSEFEYNFNKNNTEDVVDKKTVREYADLYAIYKMKVRAALDAKMDTISSFQKEFRHYRDMQIRPLLVPEVVIEQQCQDYYNGMLEMLGGKDLIRPAHILVMVSQKASPQEQEAKRQLADSIYNAIVQGEDFERLALEKSDDTQSAREGGALPWIGPGNTLQEFEDVAYSLQVGEMSKPFLSPVGYHIILMSERKQFEPYEFHRESIYQFLEQRGIRAHAKRSMGQKLAAQMGGNVTPEEALAKAEMELDSKYPEFGFLMKEFYEGSLLYEISTREVWNKAAEDTEGLEKYFKKNKKNYNYDEPVYRGLVVHCVSDDVLKQVQKLVKKQPQKEWVKVIREAFNSDSLLQVKMVRGPFKATQNVYADYYAFEQGERPDTVAGFPVTGVIGKLQKKGPDSYEDVRGPVTADYQNLLEQLWVKELRKRYSVTLYPEALETVNKH